MKKYLHVHREKSPKLRDEQKSDECATTNGNECPRQRWLRQIFWYFSVNVQTEIKKACNKKCWTASSLRKGEPDKGPNEMKPYHKSTPYQK